MKVMLIANLPHESFNALVRKGTAGDVLKKILSDLKPEATYFTEIDGRRTAVLILELADASGIPSIAEPWFLNFNADVHLHPVMTPDALERADLAAVASKWG